MAGEFANVTLGQLLTFANGRSSPDRAEGLPHPVYGSNGIIGYANDTNAAPHSVIIGRVGSYCGSLYFTKQQCWVTDNAIRANAREGNDARFLYYLLGMLNLNNWRSGSGQPLLNQEILSRIPSAVPPLADQRAIAHILGALDDKIELNHRINETSEAMMRALFAAWFVNFDVVRAKIEGRDPRLPKPLADLFPDSLVESELGAIPEGWRAGRLGDVAEHPRRGLQPGELNPSMPYIALEHMPRRCIALSQWSTAEGIESGKFAFKKGEILFGKLRPYFHKVGVAAVDGVCSTDIVVIAPRQDRWFGFVLAHVSSDAFVEYTNAGSTGTKMPRTSWSEMARYGVVLPPEQIASAFTSQTRPIVDRIIASIHESRTLSALRDTLGPKLISGVLRLKDAEAFVERAV